LGIYVCAVIALVCAGVTARMLTLATLGTGRPRTGDVGRLRRLAKAGRYQRFYLSGPLIPAD
jgi:hypothetical protein